MAKYSEPFDNGDYYSDDPVRFNQQPQKRKIPAIFGALLLLVGGSFFVQTTLASNISLNTGAPVEFGQGFVATTACDPEITITPFSTFINAQGGGEHRLSSIRLSGIDSSAGACEGKTFRVRAYGATGPALDLFKWEDGEWNGTDYDWTVKDSYDFVDINRTDSDFLWTSGGTDNDDVINIGEDPITESAFTINFVSVAMNILRTPLVSTDVLKRITVETFETYNVGDIGPGGGIVFYVAETPFDCGQTLTDTCNFLEAAPTTGANAWIDADYLWSGNTTVAIGSDARGTAIGTGYKNTLAMVGQASGGSTADRAATKAREYGGPNSLSDWFLPSKDELNQMCKWVGNVAWTSDATVCFGGTINTGPGAAGFVENLYWSSSESGAGNAWGQYFDDGYQTNLGAKNSTFYVRPVRAF
jgi:hypothetical protein